MKIYIFGGPASGKSVLARELGKRLSLSVFSMDSLVFENGIKLPENEMYKRLREVTRRKNWIVEGSFLGWSDFILEECDVVIHVKVNLLIAFIRIWKRHIKKKTRFSFLSTVRLSIKTLPAYYKGWVAEYLNKHGAGRVVKIGNIPAEAVIRLL